jgi:ornithine carbamoyltransferase
MTASYKSNGRCLSKSWTNIAGLSAISITRDGTAATIRASCGRGSHHPCQALADVMTLQEEFGDLAGIRVAFIGDGNNVCHSLIQAAAYLGFTLAISTPEGFEPKPEIAEAARAQSDGHGGAIELGHDVREAVRGADAVYTDVWASMGQEAVATY